MKESVIMRGRQKVGGFNHQMIALINSTTQALFHMMDAYALIVLITKMLVSDRQLQLKSIINK